MSFNIDLSDEVVSAAEETAGTTGSQGWEVLPEGWYEAMVVEADFKDFHLGTALTLKISMLAPELTNRHIYHRLTLSYEGDRDGLKQALAISKRSLRDILLACGESDPPTFKSVNQILTKPLLIHLATKKEDENRKQYADKNGFKQVVWGFQYVNQPTTDKPQPGTTSTPPPGFDDVPF